MATRTSSPGLQSLGLVRRLAAVAAIAMALVIAAAACSGGAPAAIEGPLPTPTPLRPTLSGSPLDAIDNETGTNGTAQGELASTQNNSADALNAGDIDPDAIDCTVHAQDPSICTRGSLDGLDAIRFDESLWSYTQDGFPVYTNVTEPYPIEEVVAATVAVARAELAGQNQALFPHLANRRTAAPYVDIGVWSVTFLFAEDPAADPAQVKVAVQGTTADGDTVEELVTYLWQWTPDRWIPEWERLTDLADTNDTTNAPAETTNGATDTTSGTDSGSTLEQPPAGGAWCPPGFPYAHSNGKCYANPINPNDQVGGPPITEPLPVQPGAPFITQPNE